MSTSTLYHTQGTYGYKHQRTEHKGGLEIYHVNPTAKRKLCPKCKSRSTRLVETGKRRSIRGLFIGAKKVIISVLQRRIICDECGASSHEPIAFSPAPRIGYTKRLADFVLMLRPMLSIKDVAKLTGLHWDTVKQIEKKWLGKKYDRPRLKDVAYLGIDEVYMGKRLGYLTVVRDLDSGAVLHVGKGKGAEGLKEFRKRVRRRKGQIKAVAIDMANSYAAWVREALPESDIVYDHFHVIKLMNDRMNTLRRSTMKNLEQEQQKDLKGSRFLFLRNLENLNEDDQASLVRLRETYSDLGEAHMMKECLRNIYKMTMDSETARLAFIRWCEKAMLTGIACLKQMAKTIENRIEGLLGYWRYGCMTSASQEGFNNKIGWLTRQAYGYRDEEYLILKIYDLPNLSTRKAL